MTARVRRFAIGLLAVLGATSLTALIWAGLDWPIYVRVFKTAGLWYLNAALLTVAVHWLVTKIPFERFSRPVFFGLQLVAAFVFAGLMTAMAYLDLVINPDPDIVVYFRRMSIQYFNIGIFIYGAIAGWLYTLQFQRRLREQAVRQAELERLAQEAELKALKAQINPHFLFNTLNTVNALAATDPEKARSINAQLAGVIRYSLDGSESDVVTLRQELDFLEDYVAIESARLGERFRFNLHVQEGLENVMIPPLTLQPLVENAVKHGVASQPNGGTVDVSIESRDGFLRCEVRDTGPGIGPQKQADLLEQGMGLKNVTSRLRSIYGNSATLTIEGNHTGGCIAAFSVPVGGAMP